MFMRIDHVGIACHDLEEKIAFYETTFGLIVVAREVNEEQGVKEAMLHVADGQAGGSYIQLLEPLGPDTPVGKFLAKRGEGVHHVGYGVDDVAAALEAIGGQGRATARRAPRHGSMGSSIAFLASEGRGRSADRAGAGTERSARSDETSKIDYIRNKSRRESRRAPNTAVSGVRWLSPEVVPRVHYPVTRSIRAAMIRRLHHV